MQNPYSNLETGRNQSCFFRKTGSTKKNPQKDDDDSKPALADNYDTDADEDEEKDTSGRMTLRFYAWEYS